MATRATYEFIKREYDALAVFTCIYKHHDGYPTGAVQHLENASTAESFLRKHTDAEIIADHDTAGDTEYRYTIDRRIDDGYDKTFILVKSRVGFSSRWKGEFFGTLEEFRAKYWNDDHAEAFGNVRDRLAG